MHYDSVGIHATDKSFANKFGRRPGVSEVANSRAGRVDMLAVVSFDGRAQGLPGYSYYVSSQSKISVIILKNFRQLKQLHVTTFFSS
jgi:hypothetical protein